MPTTAAGPCDLVEGPDGALWGEDILVNIIFRIDPKTGVVQEYPIPFTTPVSNVTIPGVSQSIQDRTAFSCAIRTGNDGKLYASNGLRNQLVQINPSTKKIKILQPPVNPAGDLQPFNDITPAKDGMYFTQTTGNVFTFYDFATGGFTNYKIPTPLALPLGLKVASNGNLYIALLLANKILEFNPNTKAIVEYDLPLPGQLPTVVRAEKNGFIYFAMFTGDGIGRINLITKKIELFTSSQLGGLGAENTIDSRGGVWLSYFTVDVLARLDTSTLKYTYVPYTPAAALLNGVLGDIPPFVDVAVNYGPGDAIWFTSIGTNQVGRYKLS
ncbi:hypothetical protein LTR78_006077 [Recurvomyces mirabilis]|uniref:SMP-30/Gluconolactonase/LRE-like region domain-containing protein n=1 Tax=Recurvomyces mirabilis TaxID=574656 RepID=A0AAE0WLF8_9PEZI|nr:hypothetical protein LTR78_006077 [Recurvomyces mirabilis]KAK5151919.1 hypothetical protein LTS14_008693 [Recurvomyces mirabilis]